MYDPDKSYDEFERNYQIIRSYINENMSKLMSEDEYNDVLTLSHLGIAIESIRNLYLETNCELLRRMLKEKEDDKSCNCSRTV